MASDRNPRNLRREISRRIRSYQTRGFRFFDAPIRDQEAVVRLTYAVPRISSNLNGRMSKFGSLQAPGIPTRVHDEPGRVSG